MHSLKARAVRRATQRFGPPLLVLALVASPLLASPAAAGSTSLRVVATSPGNGALVLSGSSRLLIRFNDTIAVGSGLPTISPVINGTWTRVDRQLLFTPSGAWPPDNDVTVTVPDGPTGVVAADGSTLRRAKTIRFEVGDGSLLRAQQLLSRLNYLPISWKGAPTRSIDAYERAAFNPPRGHFSFIGQAPHQLTSVWKPGIANRIWTSALAAFETNNGLSSDGLLSGPVWLALLDQARHPAAHRLKTGFTFAVANQRSPETLTIWRGGTVVLNTLANTGIPQAPTADGLFSIYAKLRFQIMRGTDPFGQKYADPVSWISYFNGSDAVHYFDRPGYGYRQSLGCVELPLPQAEQAYGLLTIGTLISVIN